jgi:glucosamine-6-phosphate deaminase
MIVRVFDTPAAASAAAARTIADCLERNPAAVLGLPTGRTSVPVYDALVRRRPDFSRAHTFNLDEFVGVAPGDPRSFRAFMDRHLFGRVNISTRRIHFLDGSARDPERECLRFERAIARAGGIDLLLLGLGANGHIGFNEPGRVIHLRTHRTRLTRATRLGNAAPFGALAQVPREALTMGIGTILAARTIILIAIGPRKAAAVRSMTSGRVTPRVPASFLQLHEDVSLVLDRLAAARIEPS